MYKNARKRQVRFRNSSCCDLSKIEMRFNVIRKGKGLENVNQRGEVLRQAEENVKPFLNA